MGQMIMPYGLGETILVFDCDAVGCARHADIYQGQDFIAKRREAHADGWRQKRGKWFKNECGEFSE